MADKKADLAGPGIGTSRISKRSCRMITNLS